MNKNITRILTLALTLVILVASLVGCSDNHPDLIEDSSNAETTVDTKSDESADDTQSEISDEPAENYEFLKTPAEGNELVAYRAEVRRRLAEMNKDENAAFVTEDEEKFMEEIGYNIPGRGLIMDEYSKTYGELSTYYFPIVYQDGENVQVWCITEYGELRLEAISGRLHNGHTADYFGNVNYTTVGDEEIVKNFEDVAVVYDEKSGHLSFWSLGEKLNEHTLPENSIYTGFSYWEGYIFRSGTDVYAVRDYGIYSNRESGVYVIAHNVQYVIDADYAMGSDDWSQPLFLMTDGTMKGYCTWMGNDGAPADDESYLYEVRYEGSYDK